MTRMTEHTAKETVPVFTEGDRLRKARELKGLDQEQFADLLGVSRGTISNYERSEERQRKPIVLRAWALATGVSLAWLETGHGTNHPCPPARTDGPADLLEQARQEKLRRMGRDSSGPGDIGGYDDVVAHAAA